MLNLDKSTWTRVRLGGVARLSKEKVDPADGSVARYVAGEHMDTDDLRIHRWGDVGDGYLGPAFNRSFHAGQVLYGSRRTYLRKVAVPDFYGVCANTTFVIDADTNRVSSRFLPFVMSSEPFHANSIVESRGSVNPYVNWSDIAKFEFSLPSLEEQERIADLLWAVERYRASLGNLQRAAVGSQLKDAGSARSALLNRLLAQADQLWGRAPLGQLGQFTRGRRFTKKDYVDHGIWCIHYGQIFTDFDAVTSKALTFLPETMSPSLRFAQPGDLIIAGTSEDVEDVCKAVAWMGDEQVAIHDDCFTLSHSLEPRFASYVFASSLFQQQKARFVSESKVVRVAAADLARIVIPVPPREVQVQIVQVVDSVSSAGKVVEQEVSRVQALYLTLLAEIFGAT